MTMLAGPDAVLADALAQRCSYVWGARPTVTNGLNPHRCQYNAQHTGQHMNSLGHTTGTWLDLYGGPTVVQKLSERFDALTPLAGDLGKCDDCRKATTEASRITVEDGHLEVRWVFCSYDCLTRYDREDGFARTLRILERSGK